MNKKRLFLILLLLASAVPVFAAGPLKVTGKVCDAQSGEPVPGAILQLDDNYLWAVTGEEGEFTLDGCRRDPIPWKRPAWGTIPSR